MSASRRSGEVFCRHFWITTSGTSIPGADVLGAGLGVDRILFAVDWLYVANKPAVDWAMRIPLCAEDREKILGGNARRLLKMARLRMRRREFLAALATTGLARSATLQRPPAGRRGREDDATAHTN